jgi:DNA-binding transcriptional LysR family regulator
MDRLARLRLFVQVGTRGSLSGAGRALGIGQSAASKALAALEREVGARLVLRSTRRLSLTEAGQRFLDQARTALQLIDEAMMEAADEREPKGTLRLHGPAVFGERYLGPWAIAFQRRHSQVRCSLTFLDGYVDPIAEGADLSVRMGPVDDPSVVRRRIATMERLLVASPTYLRRRGMPTTPASLRSHDGVRFTGLRQGDQLVLGGLSTELPHVFLANNAVVLEQALLAGLGIGLVARWLVHEAVVRGALVPVLPEFQAPLAEINVVLPGGRLMPARTRAFITVLERNLPHVPGVTLLRAPE